MNRRILWLGLTLLALVSGSAAAQEAKIVLIWSDKVPKFDVLYHRALANTTGAVLFGLVGAGIQSGAEASRDASKREELSPLVDDQVWNDYYVKALSEALAAKGYEPKWVTNEDKPENMQADVYVRLFPGAYGFRIVDTSTSLVSAYVEFYATYTREPPKSNKKADKEAFYMTGQGQYPYANLVQDAAMTNSEVQNVLAASARRLANKIIYNIK